MIDKLCVAYVRIRDERDRLRKEYKEKDAELEAKLDKLEEALKAEMDKLGVESLRTPHGTAFKTFKDYVTIESWESFFAWMLKEKAYHFLTRSVAKSAVKEYLTETERLPPGLRYERELEVQVRRPT